MHCRWENKDVPVSVCWIRGAVVRTNQVGEVWLNYEEPGSLKSVISSFVIVYL